MFFSGEFGNSFLITILICQCSGKDILLPQINFVRKNQVKVSFENTTVSWDTDASNRLSNIINTIFLNYYLLVFIPWLFPRKNVAVNSLEKMLMLSINIFPLNRFVIHHLDYISPSMQIS